MVYAVGLTGNIASGKSTAAKIFSDFGIEVINADLIAKTLTNVDSEAYQKIIERFGRDIVLRSKELDRRHLREIIFANPEERQWLESLLHPLIRQQIEEEVNLCVSPYCVIEIPLLLNKKNYPYLNRILLITASEGVQIQRVIERDHCSKEHAMAILSSQPEINLRLKTADDVVVNDSNITTLKKVLTALHYQYLKESNNKR